MRVHFFSGKVLGILGKGSIYQEQTEAQIADYKISMMPLSLRFCFINITIISETYKNFFVPKGYDLNLYRITTTLAQ